VCWTKEKHRFKQFGQALANFYSQYSSKDLDDQQLKNMVQQVEVKVAT